MPDVWGVLGGRLCAVTRLEPGAAVIVIQTRWHEGDLAGRILQHEPGAWRVLRLEPRRRPHYRPWERLTILWHQARYRLSNAATAKAFMVSVQALVNWHRDAAKIERTLVEGRTPLKRASDLVAALIVRLKDECPPARLRRVVQCSPPSSGFGRSYAGRGAHRARAHAEVRTAPRRPRGRASRRQPQLAHAAPSSRRVARSSTPPDPCVPPA